VADSGPYAGAGVADAWARIETGLSRVLPASLPQLAAPAEVDAIDAVETTLGVVLPQDFRASLRIRNGTKWGQPWPVPLERLYDTNEIIEATREWRALDDADPQFDDPRVWAYLIDRGMIWVHGPVRPTPLSSPSKVIVGTMNGDVHWYLDLDPAPGGTPGQVVRVDPEGTAWDVLAPSWRQLLVRYAEDLELFAAAPDSSALVIDEHVGPACEWGSTLSSERMRPAWLQDIQPRNPYSS
jgi:cell wall assembly regulator SMI1